MAFPTYCHPNSPLPHPLSSFSFWSLHQKCSPGCWLGSRCPNGRAHWASCQWPERIKHVKRNKEEHLHSSSKQSDGESDGTHVSPLAELFGSVPLQFLISLVAHDGGPAPGQAPLGDIHVVALHPLRPVATVAAVDKTGAFQEERGPGHHWRFLEDGRRTLRTENPKNPKRCSSYTRTRSRAAARMEASGMVPGSQQLSRNWKRFIPCRMAPRFTTFLFFMASWLAARRSWKPWGPTRHDITSTGEEKRA